MQLPNQHLTRLRLRARPLLLAAATLVALATAAPAGASDMRHRLQQHVFEGYWIASVGGSITSRGGEVVPGYALPSVGVGMSFPGSGCGVLGVWGLELTLGPALPLIGELPVDTHLVPSVIYELPLWNLQLFARGGLILPMATGADPGVTGALLAGWYARPMSFRVGVAYDMYPSGRMFTGLRFEVLWLGEDSQSGR